MCIVPGYSRVISAGNFCVGCALVIPMHDGGLPGADGGLLILEKPRIFWLRNSGEAVEQLPSWNLGRADVCLAARVETAAPTALHGRNNDNNESRNEAVHLPAASQNTTTINLGPWDARTMGGGEEDPWPNGSQRLQCSRPTTAAREEFLGTIRSRPLLSKVRRPRHVIVRRDARFPSDSSGFSAATAFPSRLVRRIAGRPSNPSQRNLVRPPNHRAPRGSPPLGHQPTVTHLRVAYHLSTGRPCTITCRPPTVTYHPPTGAPLYNHPICVPHALVLNKVARRTCRYACQCVSYLVLVGWRREKCLIAMAIELVGSAKTGIIASLVLVYREWEMPWLGILCVYLMDPSLKKVGAKIGRAHV